MRLHGDLAFDFVKKRERVRRRDRERLLEREQLVGDTADREHVGPAINLVSQDLLRRDVVRREHHVPCGRLASVHGLGDTEVQNLQRPYDLRPVVVLMDDEVYRLDVTVDDVPLMSVVQAVAELLDEEQAFRIRQRHTLFDEP